MATLTHVTQRKASFHDGESMGKRCMDKMKAKTSYVYKRKMFRLIHNLEAILAV